MRRVTFVGYWRRGVSEDGLREQAEAGVPDEAASEADGM